MPADEDGGFAGIGETVGLCSVFPVGTVCVGRPWSELVCNENTNIRAMIVTPIQRKFLNMIRLLDELGERRASECKPFYVDVSCWNACQQYCVSCGLCPGIRPTNEDIVFCQVGDERQEGDMVVGCSVF